MEKIKTLFARNMETDKLVRNEVTAGAEWVLAGEGIATRKFDGSPVMLSEGRYFKRYDVKKDRTPPTSFLPAQNPDPITGHWPGWVPVDATSADKWFRLALNNYILENHTGPYEPETFDPGVAVVSIEDGTFEAIGPHFQGNPENILVDTLVPHGIEQLEGIPLDFEGLRLYLREAQFEGIVWHHPDGRMVKLKCRDFGFKRSAPNFGPRPL